MGANITAVGGLTVNDKVVLTSENESITTDGYLEMGNGMIMQWGRVPKTVSGALAITFPIPFPTACLNVQVSPEFTLSLANPEAIVSFNTTTLNVTSTSSDPLNYFILYQAIGY